MIQIPDQIPVWDTKHANGDHNILRGVHSPLAELTLPYIKPGSYILELGCGIGRDAEFFSGYGHHIIATDGSEVVISQNKVKNKSNITYQTLDMRDTLPYEAGSFDVVFCNLALHYYSHEQTQKIINNILRIVKHGGLLSFACKSYDSLHNSGEEVESNVFVSPTGATIHLFSISYMKELLNSFVTIEYIDEIDEDFNGRQSKIVRCIARNIT